MAVLALALAAAAHVEAQHDIAELLEHLAGLSTFGRGLIAAKAVHDDEGRAALARPHAVRDMHDA